LEETWRKKKDKRLAIFLVLGYDSWAHIPYENHKSLQPKNQKIFFVNYLWEEKYYHLYVPRTT
jgi:hypothetical protein